jgi:cysteine synthase
VSRSWAAEAIRLVHAGQEPTPVRRLSLRGVRVWVKDESAHPTGSLKHRLVRAMFCDAIATGGIVEGTQVVAATGGAVAVAGAHFAARLGLSFTAVVPAKTAPAVLERIEAAGGCWRFADGPPAGVQQEAAALADRWGGHFLDHFADAERAAAACHAPTIADELFDQVDPTPAWIVVGAGTGATSATIGRHLRRHGLPTRLAVVDPENSAYFPAWARGARDYGTGMPTRIPGIGRPRVEPGFRPALLDVVVPVPDAASVAALWWLRDHAGIAAGPATGTALWGAVQLIDRGATGDVVLVLGDGAETYRHTYFDPDWVRARDLDPVPYETELARLTGS